MLKPAVKCLHIYFWSKKILRCYMKTFIERKNKIDVKIAMQDGTNLSVSKQYTSTDNGPMVTSLRKMPFKMSSLFFRTFSLSMSLCVAMLWWEKMSGTQLLIFVQNQVSFPSSVIQNIHQCYSNYQIHCVEVKLKSFWNQRIFCNDKIFHTVYLKIT